MSKSLIFHMFLKDLEGLLLFGLPTAQDGPRGHQDRPKSAQEASKTAPGRPKRPPRRPQEGPKTAQEASKTPKMAPRRPKRHPKRDQKDINFWIDFGTDFGSILEPQEMGFQLRCGMRGAWQDSFEFKEFEYFFENYSDTLRPFGWRRMTESGSEFTQSG